MNDETLTPELTTGPVKGRVGKMSVKVEINGDDYGDMPMNEAHEAMINDTLWAAIDRMRDEDKSVLNRFFTMRFDLTEEGGMAATVTAAAKH